MSKKILLTAALSFVSAGYGYTSNPECMEPNCHMNYSGYSYSLSTNAKEDKLSADSPMLRPGVFYSIQHGVIPDQITGIIRTTRWR